MDNYLRRICGLPPVIYPDSAVLILGTLPGQASVDQGKYYADPTNKFWRILFEACGKPEEKSSEARNKLLEEYKIALWDVLESAIRDGSSDDSLKDEKPNDFPGLLTKNPNIKLLLFHSKDAYKYFQRFFKNTSIPYVVVSSPSGQNRKSTEEKILEWRAALSSVIPQLQIKYRLEWKNPSLY